MIKVSAQTFSTASRTEYEINIRSSDLYDNLHSFLRFYKNNYTIRIIIRIIIRHRNKYCKNLKEFNCISQLYHSSLFYIKGRSDFQAKGLNKENFFLKLSLVSCQKLKFENVTLKNDQSF